MSNIFSYFLEWFKIDIKKNYEYKINFFSNFVLTFINAIIVYFIYFILNKNFDFFILKQEEIIFLVILMFFVLTFLGVFSLSKKLFKILIKGSLNMYLIRPVNIFWQYFLQTSKTRRFFTSLFYFVVLIIYSFYLEINFFKFILALSFAFYGGLFFLVSVCFFDSFSFYFKDGGLFVDFFKDLNNMMEKYPYSFLESISFSKVFLLIPVLFYGSVVTEYLFGYRTINNILEISLFILFFMVLFLILTIFNWKKGLKLYEGFG